MFCTNPECPDVKEPGSSAKYRESVSNCPSCGAILRTEPPRPNTGSLAEKSPDDDRGFVVVARLDNAPSLAVVCSMLDEAGIRHFVRNQQSFSPWGGQAAAGILDQAELAVEPGRATEAEQLLIDAQQAVPQFDEPPSEGETEVRTSVPGLARVVFFGIASVLFFTAVVIGLLQSEKVNGFWLFLGVLMGIIAWNTQNRRRQAKRDERH